MKRRACEYPPPFRPSLDPQLVVLSAAAENYISWPSLKSGTGWNTYYYYSRKHFTENRLRMGMERSLSKIRPKVETAA